MTLFVGALLLAATAGVFMPSAASGPGASQLHAGCYYFGWSASPLLPLVPTEVKDKATYQDISLAPMHPPPYNTMPCESPQVPFTHWTSWAGSCLGVPPNTAIFGAWCGPTVGSSGQIFCTIRGVVPGVHSDPFTIGFDENHDGYANEKDANGAAPLSTEPWAAPYGLPWSGVGDPSQYGQVPYPVGARMIAFPLSTIAFGATTTANFAVNCISP